ncbi:MAG: hypothetical protein BWY17_04111 [Deltaproteobacteria bacterium ADurb.Bin207]|nr:MAG: hypothetical protein BWY17_04111 [Deltaproteobacteria bacterium ADurb.Bin207]
MPGQPHERGWPFPNFINTKTDQNPPNNLCFHFSPHPCPSPRTCEGKGKRRSDILLNIIYLKIRFKEHELGTVKTVPVVEQMYGNQKFGIRVRDYWFNLISTLKYIITYSVSHISLPPTMWGEGPGMGGTNKGQGWGAQTRARDAGPYPSHEWGQKEHMHGMASCPAIVSRPEA